MKWLEYLAAGLMIAFAAFVFWKIPPGELDPFCTYDSQYELTASLRVGSEILQSTVRTQNAHSRSWIRGLGGSCSHAYGRALSFLSSDGRVFLMPTSICQVAEEVLLDVGKVDVIRMYRKRWNDEPVGFVVTDAAAPRTWQTFDVLTSGEPELVALDAKSYRWGSPTDDIDELVPSLGKTYFEEGARPYYTPDRLLRRPGKILYRAQEMRASLR